MDFVSPRFQGHQRLLDILNQPEGGTAHLQPGDTGADVQAVQQALWDLSWTFLIEPTVEDVNQFVIGTFGPVTAKVVLAFRTHYNLVFAGAAGPTSTIGTATLTKLDMVISGYDASVSAIKLHAQKLNDRGTRVTLDNDPLYDPYPGVVKGTDGVYWQAFVGGVSGAIMHRPSTGAFYVIEPLWGAYLVNGFGGGPLGFPVWDTYDDGGVLRCDFEGGSLRENGSGGVDVLPPPSPVSPGPEPPSPDRPAVNRPAPIRPAPPPSAD